MEMDRMSLAGFILMFLLLAGYFLYFAPSPEAGTTQVNDSTAVTLPKSPEKPALDTAIASIFVQAPDTASTDQTLRNEDLEISFSRNGSISLARLIKHKTYDQKPLFLIREGSSDFSLKTAINGVETDLFALPFTAEHKTGKDGTELHFSAITAEGQSIRHIWTLPAKGYLLGYRLETKGMVLQRENIELTWINRMPLVEKDITDSRGKTAITFHTTEDEIDGLSESSVEVEAMTLPAGVNWVGMKQKFFLSAILSTTAINGGEIETRVEPGDETTVKTGKMLLRIPAGEVSDTGVSLSYYLGPNDYRALGELAEGFEENVYLGWPPVKWVNEYFILPVFYFLTKWTSNFGLIIIILVIVVRLVLLPLSYKSYLGMAKMRLLKPELDEIKKRFPDDQMKFSQEQMKLFNEAGASPLSGCLPLLFQMPILFAMFYLFPSCIEFRQQTLPFAEDISTYDSVINFSFTIPFLGNHLSIYTLLMTVSTLVITWQNNQMSTVEGPMKSLSYIMPLIFLFVLNSFPASLSFYYLVGNVASFIQQIAIRRFVDEDKIRQVMEAHRKKMAENPNSGQSAFMTRLSNSLKASEEARRASQEARKKNKRS